MIGYDRFESSASACLSCWSYTNPVCSGIKTAAFGGSLGFAALFFASGIPRVQKDILQVRTSFTSPKLPVVVHRALTIYRASLSSATGSTRRSTLRTT
jgi:hypothetical protein